jgi:hypothetical protein
VSPGAGRSERRLDLGGGISPEAAEPDHRDPLAVEVLGDDGWVDGLLEVALGGELALELARLVAVTLDVGLEAVLEVVGGAGDDVRPEPDPDQDADRESDEYGRQGGGVIARRVPHAIRGSGRP